MLGFLVGACNTPLPAAGSEHLYAVPESNFWCCVYIEKRLFVQDLAMGGGIKGHGP